MKSSDNENHHLVCRSNATSTINIGKQCNYKYPGYQEKHVNELVDKSIADYRWSMIFSLPIMQADEYVEKINKSKSEVALEMLFNFNWTS